MKSLKVEVPPEVTEMPQVPDRPRMIDSEDGLRALADELRGAEFIYLDTEFDSSRDGTRLSLVQLCRGEGVAIVDALRIADLAPLASALSDPATTWVLHAGQQDVNLLTQRLGIPRPQRLFDTQVAWALLGVEYSASLAYLKYRLLGIRGEKPHQADDWLRRPLPPTQIAYAADDVVHLPAIHRELAQRLARHGRTQAAYDASLEPLGVTPELPQPLTLSAFRNAWQLEEDGQAVLLFLIDWFNALPFAERATAPEPKGLLAIASRRPRTLEELSGLRAVPRRTVSIHGRTLLGGIERALSGAKRAEFTAIEPPPYATPRDILLEGWLEAIRAEVSTTLNVAPELAFPGRLMRRMKDAATLGGHLEAAGNCLTGWRAELLGREFTERADRFDTSKTCTREGSRAEKRMLE